jgi:hypothetical protein
MQTGRNDKVYFAAEQDPVKLAAGIWERKLAYEKYLRDTRLYNLYCKMHWAYFGRENGSQFSDTEVGRDGSEGELHVLKINHLRNIVQSWEAVLGNQRTAVLPVPIGDDYESDMQVKRGRAMLDHYIRSSSPAALEVVERQVREFACVYGAGWGLQLWNNMLGPVSLPAMQDEQGQQLGEHLRTGDLQSWALTPLDVSFDPWRKDSNHPWITCRVWVQKHALCKRWPEREEEILGYSPAPSEEFLDFTLFSEGNAPPGRFPFDEVPLTIFFHDPDELLENGRQAFLLSKDVVLEVGDLMYRGRDGNRRRPVRRLAPADMLRSSLGYTPAWGLLAPQEAIDSLSSIALTNSRTFGLGTLLSPKGQDVEPEQVATGLMLVEYKPGLDKPEIMKFPGTPPEVYASRREWVAEMGLQLGISGVTRGDPSALADKSGSALAFIDAKAVQASSKFQGSCLFFKEEFYLDTICIVQQFMTTERQFEVMGNDLAALTEPFSGKHLDRITKVKIESVNPLSQTFGGRMQMADTLATRYGTAGFGVADYFRFMETGNFDALTKDKAQAERNIDRENELLAQGIGPPPPPQPARDALGRPIMGLDGQPLMKPGMKVPGKRYVVAMITDDHAAHIKKHKAVLDNPAIREASTPQAAAVLQAVMDHIDEHVMLAAQLTTKRAGLMQLLGYMPLQAAMPPPMMGPPTAHPPGVTVGGAAAGHGGSPEAQAMQPRPAGPGHQPRMPELPKGPTGGRAAPGPSPNPGIGPAPGAPPAPAQV